MNVSEIIFAPQNASGLVEVIRWIIQIGSSIAVGIILFTLLLKVITVPFDVVSRIQMRKNSLIMESMRPELEKLQKQYANDKALYNQKMMALYKKNGYSMFGACLPTIITLVIFIVAINSFTNYSKYQNKVYFFEMSKAYNSAIYSGLTVDGDIISQDETTGRLIYNSEKIIKNTEEVENKGYTVQLTTENGVNYFYISSGSYTTYKQAYSLNENNEISASGGEYNVNGDKIKAAGLTTGGKTLEEFESEGKTAADFISAIGSEKAAESYHKQIEGSRFLWVKNIWAKDSPMEHPVEDSWEKFKSLYDYSKEEEAEYPMETKYALLIENLTEERQTENGYFILAIITAGMSFLMQFITSKSQKASMELQTVNGQGAQTQKIMMWMMPIMMAFFAFMYTAAFSIYLILSQAISIVSMLLINFIIDRKFKLKAAEGEPQKIRGRVYVPEVKEEEKPKKNPDENEHDFIKGGKTSHVRGRLK